MSNSVIMMPYRQKQIADKIKEIGFGTDEFDFLPVSELKFDLSYKRIVGFSFVLGNNYVWTATPGPNGNKKFDGNTNSWDGCLRAFETWLGYLKENIDAGDPWTTIQNIKEDINNIEFASYEEYFNDDERVIFCQKLDLLLVHFEKQNIDTAIIKKDIEHLKEMGTKISKKDIALLFLGYITSWSLSKIGDIDLGAVLSYIKSILSLVSDKLISLE